MATEQPYPDFIQETMFADHGTKVLITNPAADIYLEQARKRKEKEMKEKYPEWSADWRDDFDR